MVSYKAHNLVYVGSNPIPAIEHTNYPKRYESLVLAGLKGVNDRWSVCFATLRCDLDWYLKEQRIEDEIVRSSKSG